jgi:hypothetical protein
LRFIFRRRMPLVFDHGSVRIEIGQRGRSCTCDPPGPRRVRWLLRYALVVELVAEAAVGLTEAELMRLA